MKSRINICNQQGKPISQNLPQSIEQQKNSEPRKSKRNERGNFDGNHTPVQSTFEYETITPISNPREPNFQDIHHEDGDYPPMDRRGGGGILSTPQKRRHSLSVACSEEEAELLRDAARDKGMTFSNWARKTLFRSAGIAIPKRPK